MRKYTIMAIAAIALAAVSCNSGSLKPSVTGAANEILVVMDENVSKSVAGDSIFGLLDKDIPGLPQLEPYFNISRTSHDGFTGILRPVRNILIVNVGEQYSHVKMKHEQDVWAQPQSVMTINGPNAEEVAKAVGKYGDDILNYFVKAERNRAISFQSKSKEASSMNKIKEKFGFSMVVPKGISRIKEVDNALWIANSNQNLSQNIVIYSVPYVSQDQFGRDALLAVRDSVLKTLVPGPSNGSYMTTEYRYDPPSTRHTTTASGEFAAETRGLWRVEGDMMGGPFVSVSTLDKKHQRIVTAEAFIYAPNQYKRNALRLLESVLFTITFDNEPQDGGQD